jgi:orotidine-5'-phosphate decarboxylase
MQAKDRIILALDVDSAEASLALAEQLAGQVGAFKIGMQLFDSVGPQIVTRFNQLGAPVFLDLKLHDIPNTVAATAQVLTRLGVFMFNVHASGGREMMRAARAAVDQEAAASKLNPPLVLAVTVLTSLDQAALESDIGLSGKTVEQVVVAWARMAQECGLDGVVCSPQEIAAVRQACGPAFKLVTPGIRPAGADAGDQKRVTTPRQAVSLGGDYMVIGRPITGASDPRAAASAIVREITD